MIIEYNRPETIEQALALLGRTAPKTVPLGGGSALNRPSEEALAVVDLQALGLNTCSLQGNTVHLGATLTLQSLLEAFETSTFAGSGLLPALAQAVTHEASYNLRQVGTVAGTLVSADGRSPFATALLALDAALTLLPGDETLPVGDVLPLRAERLSGKLIVRVSLPSNARLSYQSVARTPADRPVVCAAVAVWPSGRTRVTLGGYGACPLLAFDGAEPAGAETAARNAFSQASDEWASAEYRQEAAAALVKRALE